MCLCVYVGRHVVFETIYAQIARRFIYFSRAALGWTCVRPNGNFEPPRRTCERFVTIITGDCVNFPPYTHTYMYTILRIEWVRVSSEVRTTKRWRRDKILADVSRYLSNDDVHIASSRFVKYCVAYFYNFFHQCTFRRLNAEIRRPSI